MPTSDFFVRHDLGHFALETTLEFREAFFGLLAAGWDISSFEQREPGTAKSRTLPLEAKQAEMIAGVLDLGRAGVVSSTEELMQLLEQNCEALNTPSPALSLDQLAKIVGLQQDLLGRWSALEPGQSLELTF